MGRLFWERTWSLRANHDDWGQVILQAANIRHVQPLYRRRFIPHSARHYRFYIGYTGTV